MSKAAHSILSRFTLAVFRLWHPAHLSMMLRRSSLAPPSFTSMMWSPISRPECGPVSSHRSPRSALMLAISFRHSGEV